MGKLHWIHNGRPVSRNFDVIEVQRKDGTVYTEKFVGHMVVGNERPVLRRVLPLAPVRRDRWRTTFMVMIGFWIALMLQSAIR